MDPERHTCTWKNEPVTLTVTEFLILQALARPLRRGEEPQRADGRRLRRSGLCRRPHHRQPHQAAAQEVQGGRRRLRHDRDAVRRRLPLQGSSDAGLPTAAMRGMLYERRGGMLRIAAARMRSASEARHGARRQCSIEPPNNASTTHQADAPAVAARARRRPARRTSLPTAGALRAAPLCSPGAGSSSSARASPA